MRFLIGAGFFTLPFLFLSGVFGEPIRVAKEMGLVALAGLISSLWFYRVHPLLSLATLVCTVNVCTTGFGPAQLSGLCLFYSAVIVAVSVYRLEEDGRIFILKCIAVMGLLQSVYGFFQVFGIDPWFGRISPTEYLFPVGTMGQPTIYGIVLVAASVSSVFLGWWPVAAITAVSAVSTTSSFTIASLVAGLSAYLYLCGHRRKFLGVVVTCALIVSTLLVFKKHPLANSLLYTHNREKIWSQAIKVAYDNVPVGGFGIGSFKVIYPQVQPEWLRLQNGKFLQAHNDYVQVFFEMGFIGAITQLLILAVFLYKLFINDLSHSQRAFGAVSLCFLVDSIGSFPLYLSPHGLFLATGLVLVIGHRRRGLIELS